MSSQILCNDVTSLYLTCINKMNNKLHIDSVKSQESSSEKRVKNKKIDLSLPAKQLNLSLCSTQKSPLAYDALLDKHASVYFQQKSVKLRLKKLMQSDQVFEGLPKHKRNSQIVSNIHNILRDDVIFDKSSSKNYEQSPSQHETIQQNSKINDSFVRFNRKSEQKNISPYRVLPKLIGIKRTKKFASLSTLKFPAFSTEGNVQNKGNTLIRDKSKIPSLKNAQDKIKQKLNKYKHGKLIDFINKKRDEIISADKRINKYFRLATVQSS